MARNRPRPAAGDLIQDCAAFVALVLFGAAVVLWTSAAEFHLATGGW